MIKKIKNGASLQLMDPPKQDIQSLEQLPAVDKLSLAHQFLERLYHRFPHMIDSSAFKELDRIGANLEDEYIHQRSPELLAKLAYSICLIRRKISRTLMLFPLKDHDDIRLFPSYLHFTFGSKPVLGILAHAYLKDKYEAFDEEHILLAVRKSVSEAQLVKGSVYTFHSLQNGIKTLYFEIDKKSGLPFTPSEVKRLRSLLKQEIKHCVERLAPLIFMTRNEEEVLRNILTLSREIYQASDLPQVMILFDRQTAQEAIFTVIVVHTCNAAKIDLFEKLTKIQNGFSCFPDRCQTVSYLDKKHPIEACVFRIHLVKDLSLLRADLSLNFYLARQKISAILQEAIGEFRDYNGGIILKQRETLTSFSDLFPEISLQNPDLLENFFYSLSPIEAQATLPLSFLKVLFELFLEALNFNLVKSSDYFLKFSRFEDHLFVMIRIPDENLKETIDQIFNKHRLSHLKQVVSEIHLQNTCFLGYVITPSDEQKTLLEDIHKSLKDWQKCLENQQILKLALENPIVSLDPRIGGDQISSFILKLLFEGLMREDRKGAIEYGIAKRVDISSDLKTYVFHLKSTRWSDGSLVSAYDFEYAWKKILSPTFKTPFAYLFYPIKNAKLAKEGVVTIDAVGVQALNDFTLKVDLRSPTPYFLDLTAHPIYSPVHRLKDQLHPNWSQEEGEAYICNGAFQLKKNHPQEGYELTKNSLYWDFQSIKLDQVIVLKTNRYQAYEMFQKNNSHWVGVPLSTWDASFTPAENDELIDFPNKNSIYWCAFNSQKPPFNNKKLRQAFALAINRQELASIFNALPAISPLPPSDSLIQESPLSIFNLSRARSLFKEALEEMELSIKDFPLIDFVHMASPLWGKVCEKIKKDWEYAFKIECITTPFVWSDLFCRITDGDFQLGAISWQSWVHNPMYTLNVFREAKEPLNFAKWEDAKYQEILYSAEREIDLERKHASYLRAEEFLIEEMPVAPIFSNIPHAIRKKSLNIDHISLIMNFKWACIRSTKD